MATINTAQSTTTGKRAKVKTPVARIVVETSMGLVAVAFGAGLYLQANLAIVPALFGALAVFIALTSALARSHPIHLPSASVPQPDTQLTRNELQKKTVENAMLRSRMSQFETDILSMSEQLTNLSGLAGKMGYVDELRPTLLNLEEFLRNMPSKEGEAASAAIEAAQIEMITGQFETMDSRIDNITTQYQQAITTRESTLMGQIVELRNTVTELSARTPDNDQIAAMVAQVTPNLTTIARAPSAPIPAIPVPVISEPDILQDTRPQISPAQPNAADTRAALTGANALSLLENIERSIENDRIDILLQPIMKLPERKTAFYEVFSRLVDANGEQMTPEKFIPLCEIEGLMPLVDNMMLIRAVKIIRRLESRSNAVGLFCTLSSQSLIDPDFFPELVGFVEKNRDLASRIIFEISQSQLNNAGAMEHESMRVLARLGFSFSLDKVTNLNVDFSDMRDRGFRFIRISANTLLNRMAEMSARIHGADKSSYLARYDIQLIVERIEKEEQLIALNDYEITLGQGYFFSEPRPVRGEILGMGGQAA